MTYNSDISLGRITKVSGFEGAVIVKLDRTFFQNIPQMESVFLEIEGRQVPFFISYSEYTGADILKLRFDDYDSVEKIAEFSGCRVFLTTEAAVIEQVNDSDIVGYDVLINEDKLIGKVSEVIQNPGQWLLNILSVEKKNILIPYHEHFIVSIDKEKRLIVMDVPQGLTEIND